MSIRSAALAAWLVGLSAAAALLATATGPLLHQVAAAGAGPDAPVAAAAALAGWVVLAWLTLAVAVSVAEAIGVPLARSLAALAPRTVRAAVRTSLGAGLAVGVLPAVSAQAAAPAEPPASVVRMVGDHTPDWPSLDRPAAAVRRPERSAAHPRTPTQAYVVRAGDTLWAIAAAHLRDEPSASDIAAAWPQWWRLNRATIGGNPGLIHPGQVLRVPPTGQSRERGESRVSGVSRS